MKIRKTARLLGLVVVLALAAAPAGAVCSWLCGTTTLMGEPEPICLIFPQNTNIFLCIELKNENDCYIDPCWNGYPVL